MPISPLKPERWEKVREILGNALDLPSSDRASYLETACGGDPVLQREVLHLLAADESASTGFLKAASLPTGLTMDDSQSAIMLGRRVGAYQIAELIGEGGMGEVYRAFRADDQYCKQVALKLVHAGQDSHFVVSRFKNERQILASLDHPNIARLLDGGTTEEGAPYFVMELIEGQPLGEHCNDRKLRIQDRLRLFLQVCSAVQFAHQRLVVHRDIKPSNILVTADGTPKLLDFGVSKILDPEAALGQGDATMTALRAFTPAYASPEQIKGEPITTASDMYSLGVVLYELLTGRSPYPGSARTPHEISRAVCDLEPERPSVTVRRMASAESGKPMPAQHADVSPARLSKQLRGDLDNIVLMALRAEPERRYASVEEFAADIRRHLEHQPVVARKGTFGYRAAKFARRHSTGLMATAIVVVALLVAMGVTLAQKRRADARFNDVRALANSLLFEIHDSIRDLPGSTPARKLIVDRALRYLDRLSAEGGSDPSLMRELAAAYERVGEVQGHYLQNSLGETADSLRSYQKALQIREQLAARSRAWSDQLALAKDYRLAANQLWAMGDSHGVAESSANAVSISESLAKERPNDLDVLNELASDYENSAQCAGAQEGYRKSASVDAAILKLDPQNERVQRAYEIDLIHLGEVMNNAEGDRAGALDTFRKSLEIAQSLNRRSPTTQHLRDVAIGYHKIAQFYSDTVGDSQLALENYREALQLYQQVIAADPENALFRQGLAIAYANVGWEEGMSGERTASLNSLDKSLEAMKSLVVLSPQNVQQQGILAEVYLSRGDNLLRWHESQQALQDYGSACSIYGELARQTGNPRDGNVARCQADIGYAALQAGRTETAGAAFHRSLTLAQPLLVAAKPEVDDLYHAADAYSGLGDLEAWQAGNRSQSRQNRRGHWQRAEDWYQKSLALWDKVPPDRRDRHGSSPAQQDPNVVMEKLRHCEGAQRSANVESRTTSSFLPRRM